VSAGVRGEGKRPRDVSDADARMVTSRALGGPLPTKMSWDVIWRFRRRGLLCAGTVEPRLWVAMLSERLEMTRAEIFNLVLPHPLSWENEPRYRKRGGW